MEIGYFDTEANPSIGSCSMLYLVISEKQAPMFGQIC